MTDFQGFEGSSAAAAPRCPGAGCARGLRCLVAAALLLLGFARDARAVVTFDLLHDTPRTRDLLKEELASSTVAPGASGGAALPAAGAAREDLEAIWFARERYLQIGENEKAQQQIQLLWERAMERGMRNLPEYAAVLVREARRRMRTGDWAQAERALGNARRIAPDELAVYTTGAALVLRRNPFNLAGAWHELALGASAVGRSFRLQSWIAGNLLHTAVAGTAFFFVAAVTALFAAAAARIAHDAREAIGFGPARARTAISWLLVASPALVGLSPWWWPILGGLVLWPYLDRAPRALLAAGALFALALPWAVRASAGHETISGRPLLAAVLQVREGHWGAADHAELKRQSERGTAGLPGVTALGLAARRLGRLDEAEAAYNAGLASAPEDPVLLNNLGNVAFARQDAPKAIALYTRAAGAAPGMFAPHYNLGLAYRGSFKFVEGEAESRRAAEIDPEAAAFYAGLDPARFKEFTVDELPPTADLWRLARAGGEEQAAHAEALWAGLLLGPSAEAWPVVLLVLLAAGGALGAWRLRADPAAQCERCGRLFCARCQAGRRGELCSQCHHVFVRKEGVDARARVQKMGEIKAHRGRLRVRHIAFAALAPGAGHLSAGRFLPGVAFLLPASPLEAWLLFGRSSHPSPWSLGATSGWLLAAAAVVFAALWAASLWLATRLEE